MVKTRYQAFGIHLGISSIIFFALLAVLFFYWYPGFLFSADGGWDGVKILVGIDLVLGPVLTLIVYKHGKPGLKFDLTIIVFIQTSCLLAGMWLVHSERPLVIVFVDGQFYSISSNDYLEAGVKIPDVSQFPGTTPKWVKIDIPEDVFEQSELRKITMREGKRLRFLTHLYASFSLDKSALAEEFDQNTLLDRDRESQALPNWLAAHGGKMEDYVFYPFGARYKYAFIGFNRSSREIAGWLDTPREG